MEKLTIDRQKWLRGAEVPTFSRKEKREKLCSFAYYAKEKFGGTAQEATEKAVHDMISRKLPLFYLVKDLIAQNDDPLLEEPIREEKLIELFKQLDIDLQFSN